MRRWTDTQKEGNDEPEVNCHREIISRARPSSVSAAANRPRAQTPPHRHSQKRRTLDRDGLLGGHGDVFLHARQHVRLRSFCFVGDCGGEGGGVA